MAFEIPPKPTTAVTRDDLKEQNVESYKVVESSAKLEEKTLPKLDYSDPSNFVTYGSAEEYYNASIENIYNNYPYDGSKNEKNEWSIAASGLDQYVFDNEYPRRNGHVSISYPDWGTPAASLAGPVTNRLPTNLDYITILGGPNTDATATNLASLFPSTGGKANVIDSEENQGPNLTLADSGTTLEFWIKKDGYAHPGATREVVFDMKTPEYSHGDPEYARFAVSLRSSPVPSDSEIEAYICTGSDDGIVFDFSSAPQGFLTDGSWHHVAIVMDPGYQKSSLYVDGLHLQDSTDSSGAITTVTSIFNANVGSQIESLTLESGSPAFLIPATAGWNKMSGSLDEFRFWKTARTAEEIGLNYNTQVYGGTNTDTANTDLGVYYKFNEGILGTSQDAVVLDYSGRISNGSWTGYTPGARSLTSALVESGKAAEEFKDPIIYETHPDVVSLKSSKSSLGLSYDQQNNASLYLSLIHI